MFTITNILIVLLAFLLIVCVIWLVLRQEMTFRYLKRQAEEKRNRFAVFSHRLRTPLTGIKWYAELMASGEHGNLSISQSELLNKMQHSVEGAIEQLNEYLEFAREDFKPLVGGEEAIDVREEVQRIVDSLKQYIEERKHTLHLPVIEGHMLVHMNPLLFHSIVEIIFSNAVFYTPPGDTITVSVTENGGMVCISIADTGVGIPKEDQAHIFDRFYRGRNASTLHTKGMGLGLYFARKVLRRMGGDITFTSAEGKGTTFTVELPSAKRG